MAGWRNGDKNPTVVRLRTVSVLVFLGLTVYLVVNRNTGTTIDIGVLGLMVGALLLMLGFPVVVSAPFIKPKEQDEEEEA